MKATRVPILVALLIFSVFSVYTFFLILTTSAKARFNISPSEEFTIHQAGGGECGSFSFGSHTYVPLTKRTIPPSSEEEEYFKGRGEVILFTLKNNGKNIDVYREGVGGEKNIFIYVSLDSGVQQAWYFPLFPKRAIRSAIKESEFCKTHYE